MIIFQLFKHKTSSETLRILSVMRTMKCGKLALMLLRNENDTDGNNNSLHDRIHIIPLKFQLNSFFFFLSLYYILYLN